MRIIVVAPGDMRVMISCIVVLRAVMEAGAAVRGGVGAPSAILARGPCNFGRLAIAETPGREAPSRLQSDASRGAHGSRSLLSLQALCRSVAGVATSAAAGSDLGCETPPERIV
jgi:hypothetical protein